jgi:hypothetical protein
MDTSITLNYNPPVMSILALRPILMCVWMGWILSMHPMQAMQWIPMDYITPSEHIPNTKSEKALG